MLRLIRYLKPYRGLILVSMLLLFIRANSELALPDYMSRIVNYGIQQAGVVDAVPLALRASQMEYMLPLFSNEEQAQVLGSFTLVEPGSADYAAALTQYPALENEPVYVRKELGKEHTEILNPILAKGFLVLSFIQQAMQDPGQAAAMGDQFGFDLSQLPASMDLFSLLAQLPEEQLAMLRSAIDQQVNALGEGMVTQRAVAAVRGEYAALGMDAAALQTNYIVQAGMQMLLLTLLSAACIIGVAYLSSRTSAVLARDLRRAIFHKVQSFSNAEFDAFSTASLITRSTNDITQVQMLVLMLMRMAAFAPVMGIGGIIRAIGKSTSMWWLITLAVIVLICLVVIIFSMTLPRFKRMQQLVDRLNLVARESLSGMMVIRAFNKQPYEEERFDQANQDLTATGLFVQRVMVVMHPIMNILMNGLSVLIIWVGAQQIAQAAMQVGDMMAFMQYAMQIVFSFMMMSMLFIMLPRAAVSGDRIADVLETKLAITDPEKPRDFTEPFNATIEFRDVSFRYPDAEEDALHAISFTARAGETTAFIGTTGSGKSTIVSLIPRFHDVTGGAVLVGGVDIRQVTQKDLRERIGFVPQKSNLFMGSIESNLLYADEGASREDLQEALQIAQAGEFVNTKPEGMGAEIAQGGSNVSGGQKQRLAIARALVKKAPIYIFDDSFSALDFKTDAALRRAMKEHTSGSTLLIVTQRVATIMYAEQIIVLDDGRIVGKGKHAQLLKSCEVYRDIAQSQLGAGELA